MAATLFGVNLYGFTELEQKSEVIWFVPRGSYVSLFLEKINTQYPSGGARGSVYFGGINYTLSLMKMDSVFQALQDNPAAQIGEGSVQQWPRDFIQFTSGSHLTSENSHIMRFKNTACRTLFHLCGTFQVMWNHCHPNSSMNSCTSFCAQTQQDWVTGQTSCLRSFWTVQIILLKTQQPRSKLVKFVLSPTVTVSGIQQYPVLSPVSYYILLLNIYRLHTSTTATTKCILHLKWLKQWILQKELLKMNISNPVRGRYP